MQKRRSEDYCERNKYGIKLRNSFLGSNYKIIHSEAGTGGVLQKQVFSKVSQISQENACVGVSF